jgi:hypothetical protein
MVNVDYITVAKDATDSHLSDPFFFLFSSIIEACLVYQCHNKVYDKVDFIFDACSKSANEIDRIFRQTMFTAPEKIKALSLVDNGPTFVDDQAFLPLQAADLIAGQIGSFQERGEETPAMKKLVDSGFSVAYTIYDAKLFDPLVKGTNWIRDQVRKVPPGEQLGRYLQLKAFVEKLRAF